MECCVFSHIVRILSSLVLGSKDTREGVRTHQRVDVLDGRRTSMSGVSKHAFCRQITM